MGGTPTYLPYLKRENGKLVDVPYRGLTFGEIQTLNPLIQGLISPTRLRITDRPITEKYGGQPVAGYVEQGDPYNIHIDPAMYSNAVAWPNPGLLGHEVAHTIQQLAGQRDTLGGQFNRLFRPLASYNPGNIISAMKSGKKMSSFPQEAQAEIVGNWLTAAQNLKHLPPDKRELYRAAIAPSFNTEAAYTAQLKNAMIANQTPGFFSALWHQPWLRNAMDFYHQLFMGGPTYGRAKNETSWHGAQQSTAGHSL